MVKFDVMPGVSSEKTPQGVAVTASGLMGAPDGVAWDHLKKLWEAPCEGCGDYKLASPSAAPTAQGPVYEYASWTPTTPTLPRSRSTAARPRNRRSRRRRPRRRPLRRRRCRRRRPRRACPRSRRIRRASSTRAPAPPAEEAFELRGLTLTFLIIIAAGIVLLLIPCCCLIFALLRRGGGVGAREGPTTSTAPAAPPAIRASSERVPSPRSHIPPKSSPGRATRTRVSRLEYSMDTNQSAQLSHTSAARTTRHS